MFKPMDVRVIPGNVLPETLLDHILPKREEADEYVDDDGNVCIVVKDPVTGELTKKIIGKTKKGKKKKGGADTNGMTLDEIRRFKDGERHVDSDSDYSYKSIISAGGTRHVRRRRRRADGNYSDSESYNSGDDEDGKARRRARRRDRRHGANSAHSYYSVTSEGGTRHVRRRRRRGDGTYSDSDSHHSPDEDIAKIYKEMTKMTDKKSKTTLNDEQNNNGKIRSGASDSDCSVKSAVSEGGTRRVVKKKRIRDADGNVVGYCDSVELTPGGQRYLPSRSAAHDGAVEGTEGTFLPEEEYDSDYSVKSIVSEGGTRRQVKQKRIRDEEGNVVGYGETEPLKAGEGSYLLRKKGNALQAMQALRDGKRKTNVTNTGEQDSTEAKTETLKHNNMMLRQKARQKRGNYEKESGKIELGDLTGRLIGADALNISEKIPSEFSDASTDDDVDLSKMTEEEREKYLSEKMERQHEREKRRREKYGSKFDDIMKKRERKRLEKEERDKRNRINEMRAASSNRLHTEGTKRTLSRLGSMTPSRSSSTLNKTKEKPKSMVSYEKGTPRKLSWPNQKDVKEHSLSHLRENKRAREDAASRFKKNDVSRQHAAKVPPLPPIPQGRILERLQTTDLKDLNDLKKRRGKTNLGSTTSEEFTFVSGTEAEDDGQSIHINREDTTKEKVSPFDVDASGNITLKKGKNKIDLNDMTPEMLQQLGIDPNLSKKEIANKLKEKFGQNLIITDGGTFVGTKSISEYRRDVTDMELVNDPDLDVSTLKGVRRVNILFRRGGDLLAEHLQRVIQEASKRPAANLDYAKDLDEKDARIDFLNHYRLVDPRRVEQYAKAFVVEDGDLDCVINNTEAKLALTGVQQIQNMTDKQMNYVLRVLHIDDASQVTFRMFAVISALCERVTSMDSLSKYLLEMCNLGDLERKLDLYKAMFYHNVESDRDPNHITAESLKIELIAGGLNWKQRKYILRQMIPNRFGDISFLDYITYIPLFLSIHDNICDNPFDSSTQKYCMPPRKRPPSSQRDMNPLGYPLSKRSSYLMNRQAKELIEGRLKSAHFRKEHLEMVRQFQKLSESDIGNKLSEIFHPVVREDTQMSLHDKLDLIY